jgi:hypothetical protein
VSAAPFGSPHALDQSPRFMNLALLAAMAITCGIVDALNEQEDYPEGAYWLYDDNRSGDNPHINGVVTWTNALITYASPPFFVKT